MSACIDTSAGARESEICWETTGAHLFVYTWSVDHTRTNRPTGDDYRCGLTVYRLDAAIASGPVQEFTWTAPDDLWTSGAPSPCERRDALMPFIERRPESWVGVVTLLES